MSVRIKIKNADCATYVVKVEELLEKKGTAFIECTQHNVEQVLTVCRGLMDARDEVASVQTTFAGRTAGMRVHIVRRCMQEGWGAIEKLNVKNDSGTDKHGDILVNSEGRLLKPYQNAKKAQVEVNGFRTLSCHDRFARFLPLFYGVRTHNGDTYLEIENITHELEGTVATADIKMGRKTYDDHASEEKKARESRKTMPGKCSDLGFRMVGMKAGSASLLHYDITARGGLTPEEFKMLGLMNFFKVSDGASELDREAVEYFLKEFCSLLEVMKAGYGGVLRAASLFLAREMRPKGRCILKVIDLAHFTPTSPDRIDTNFIEGLEALIKPFREIL